MKSKKYISLIFGFVAIFYGVQFGANAGSMGFCKGVQVPSGSYCVEYLHPKPSLLSTCEFGCYCSGVDNQVGLSLDVDLAKYCSRNGNTNGASDTLYSAQGIYRCPVGKSSAHGSESLADCYDILNANDNSQNCDNPPNKGYYCRKRGSKPKCEPGCYCSGGIINAVGENGSDNPYGQVLSNCRDKKPWAKEYLKKRGIFYCPDGYTSKAGAKKITDCIDANGNNYVVDLGLVAVPGVVNTGSGSCPAGSFKPQSACVACVGNTVVNDAGNGCRACESGTAPDAGHTRCIVSMGTESVVPKKINALKVAKDR